MTVTDDKRRAELFALMARYCVLGRLLPAPADLDKDDLAVVAEARLVLAEMDKTKSKLDALLKREATR